MKAHPAKPTHSPGDTVAYFDRHKRRQEGEIVRVEANWMCGGGKPPQVTYLIRHLAYSGLVHVVEEDLIQ